MNRLLSMTVAILAIGMSCLASADQPSDLDQKKDLFDFPAPASQGEILQLYATRYYVHAVKIDKEQSASSLYSKSGKSLGIAIPNEDFCFGALQGTIRVQVDSEMEIYNADGLAPIKSAVCSYKKLGSTLNEQLGRQAWVKVKGNAEFGLGVRGNRLIPFRTIAVDDNYIQIGTVFFIPKLRGWHFNDSGVERVHDGYVIAGDKGGGIVGKSHIDFFTGNYTGEPPDFVTSNPSGLFDAEIVSDKNVKDALRNESRYIPGAKSQDGS